MIFSVEELLAEQDEVKDFCPHKTSHWLGIDVHDVGDYRIGEAWRELEAGMVLCVESYIGSEGGKEGVKLEEQVLVTEQGPELLTSYSMDLQ